MSDELFRLTACGLTARFRSREATPEQALESVLARIAAVNPVLNAVVTLDVTGARAAARAAGARYEAGMAIGPLDGVPMTVKDNLFVGGMRATWGSRLFAEHVAPVDDLPVALLRQAGCVILGKTNTPELALAGYTDNRVFGSTGNPWAPDLTPGGSSGGAVAAVAAGCGAFAIATDAGGSIRRTAGLAGVAGLKPGVGRVARRHGFPALAHDLQVIGPVARSVADLRAVFGAIATPGGSFSDDRKLRIGIFGAIGDAPVDAAVTAAFAASCDVLRALGHVVETIAPPWDPGEVDALFGALASVGVARVMAGIPGWEDLVTETIVRQAHAGFARLATQYVADLDRLAAFRWRMADAIAAWDVIATPSAACTAWPRDVAAPATIAGVAAGPRAGAIFSTAINLAGLPALVVPAPVSGLPVGLQLVGRMGSEERLLDLGAAFEATCPWPQMAAIDVSSGP